MDFQPESRLELPSSGCSRYGTEFSPGKGKISVEKGKISMEKAQREWGGMEAPPGFFFWTLLALVVRIFNSWAGGWLKNGWENKGKVDGENGWKNKGEKKEFLQNFSRRGTENAVSQAGGLKLRPHPAAGPQNPSSLQGGSLGWFGGFLLWAEIPNAEFLPGTRQAGLRCCIFIKVPKSIGGCMLWV